MIELDTDFPGGNITVESLDGEAVRLQQDLRSTTEWWFHWHFRIRGAAGRTVRFTFTNGDVFTADGPCYSVDGANWRWLGREVVEDNGFTFTFPDDVNEAFFAMGVPYVQSHLRSFLAGRPAIEQSVLTRTEAGRDAELLRLRSRTGQHVVLLTARTHACESMASYVLEGILDFWLADGSPEAARLREAVDVLAIPFVDKDGVEAGDQGKLRAPHDHNRDYIDEPLYATTRAVIAVVARERDRLRVGLDLHCPWIRGERNEDFYVVGPPPPWDAAALELAQVIERSRRGEVPLWAAAYLPFGVEWNNNAQARTLSRHICVTAPACQAAVSVEIPYSRATGVQMTPGRARALGADLARAMGRFIQ
ncbi:MAG TPA: M14-type cytosolic carboxypeptidase [Tepidisphaeraceae bacterium]|jgi:hypothetical protein|nr:M14-type cytosolic carboxypeptidase [Tepidisphaeraceae bacterium]